MCAIHTKNTSYTSSKGIVHLAQHEQLLVLLTIERPLSPDESQAMILEIADISILPGTARQFEAAVTAAVPLFNAAHGCAGMVLRKCIEEDHRYQLHVRWTTLEDHTVRFRGSDAFQEWRKLAGPFFAGSPSVTHWNLAVSGF